MNVLVTFVDVRGLLHNQAPWSEINRMVVEENNYCDKPRAQDQSREGREVNVRR
jgi:hypothetical protein